MWKKLTKKFAESMVYDSVRIAVLAATHDGDRNSIDWIEPMVWRAIVDTLESQEVPRRVAADMLGYSTRNFIRKANKQDDKTTRSSIFTKVLIEVKSGPKNVEEVLLALPEREPSDIRSMLAELVKHEILRKEDDYYLWNLSPNSEQDVASAARYGQFAHDVPIDTLIELFGLDLSRNDNDDDARAIDVEHDGRIIYLTAVAQQTFEYFTRYLTKRDPGKTTSFISDVVSHRSVEELAADVHELREQAFEKLRSFRNEDGAFLHRWVFTSLSYDQEDEPE